MQVLIGKPTRHIEMFRNGNMYYADVEKFYDSLPLILERTGIDYRILDMGSQPRRIILEDGNPFLAWHNHGTLDNVWYLNISCFPDYLYFDKNGYSGWSELAQHYNYDIEVNSIRDKVQTFCDDYITNNRSRIEQPIEAFLPSEPYVLILQQRHDDSVAQHAYIDNQILLERVAQLYAGSKYRVCTKAHPLATQTYHHSAVFEATGSIHKIIAGATAVYTVNSGAGFEALLHGKRVFTAGHCDYHWATNVIKTDADLQASIDLIEQPVDRDRITKFLHYTFNHHLINVNDDAAIECKLQRVINEYIH